MAHEKRAVSVTELLTTKFKIMEFTGNWRSSLGQPELSGTWIVYGPPKNGKTRFVLLLCKYLAGFTRVAYNSLEEGVSVSFAEAVREVGMEEVKQNFILLDAEQIAELRTRLRKQKSPGIVVIDSLQYTGITYAEYRKLKSEFRNKLFIFISHSEGREPAGRVAKAVRYDANITIRVEGFKAFPNGRYGGGEPFVIWDEGSVKYWQNENNN